jgi:hypothetical protein
MNTAVSDIPPLYEFNDYYFDADGDELPNYTRELVPTPEEEAEFRLQRRQKFLVKRYYLWNEQTILRDSIDASYLLPHRRAKGQLNPIAQSTLFQENLNLASLRYTAGEPIETLIDPYREAIQWLGRWHVGFHEYLTSPPDFDPATDDIIDNPSPIHFDVLEEFQQALRVVCLGQLLGHGDLVRQAVDWMSKWRNEDIVYERLIGPALQGETSGIDEYFHENPYSPLEEAQCAAEDGEKAKASALIKTYLGQWYRAFKGAVWHDGHLLATKHQMPYWGYWSFEAAWTVVMYDLDDSSFADHLVYPKDLVAWARKNNSLDRVRQQTKIAPPLRLRCPGGESCPNAGYWFTPAKEQSRRRFASGELMPVIERAGWGATIWYRDEIQGD